ncbi:MAG: hypothetical protein LBC74_00920 [Planctomycetaceae bacterium]|jgi:hypothetical protein|nr:hypothetical protein [Planctomycetaceae bacterium]
MKSIVLSFVFVWVISFYVAVVNAQSNTSENGDSIETVAPPTNAENNPTSSINNNIESQKVNNESDSNPLLTLPPLQSTNGATLLSPVELNNSNGNSNPLTNTANENKISASPDGKKDDITNNSDDVGTSKVWKDWSKDFSPRDNNAPVPRGNLPPPPPYNGYVNNYANTYNQQTNIEHPENKPIPYLMWHRDPWTHRLNLVPYAPGYAAAPQDFLTPPSDFSLWLTNFPSHGYHWQQPKYLGYYDPMPEIVSATPSRAQMILGYPNTPQTQYRNPYTGQPLTYNPAINPPSILPVRESLLERWRRRSLERRAAPLGQFPGQPPLQTQQIQSPLFGQPYAYGQDYQQENTYQNPNEQLQPNQQYQQYQQLPEQPRYVRRPLGRFRQGLRERIQRLGIFEALTQGRSAGNGNSNQNPNPAYDEAPAYDGTN